MANLHASYFFELSSFTHASLFEQTEFVWGALDLIDSYLKTHSLGKIECDVPQGTFLIHPETISIGEGTVIEQGAYIKGPCVIGKNCTVRHGAYIRGGLIAGDSCVIGHDTEVKNAIFLNGAHAAHFAYVGDSILGSKVNLGAGTKCANLKLDGSEIAIFTNGHRYATKRRKLGAIIGDRTQIGCNAVLNPGTLMGQGVQCFPCLNIGGFIPSNSLIKMESKPLVLSPQKGSK